MEDDADDTRKIGVWGVDGLIVGFGDPRSVVW